MSTVITFNAPKAYDPFAYNALPAWEYFKANVSYLNYDEWIASVGAELLNFQESFLAESF